MVRWVWASMKPGSRVASPTSMTVAPAGTAPPTDSILFPRTTTIPGCTTVSRLPSKRREALMTVIPVWASTAAQQQRSKPGKIHLIEGMRIAQRLCNLFRDVLELRIRLDFDQHVGVDQTTHFDHSRARADGAEKLTVRASILFPP